MTVLSVRLKSAWQNRFQRIVIISVLLIGLFCLFARLFAPRIGFQLATGLKLDYDSLNIDWYPTPAVSATGVLVTDPQREDKQFVFSAADLSASATEGEAGWTLSSLDASDVLINADAVNRALAEPDGESGAESEAAHASEPAEPIALDVPEIGPISLREVTLLLPGDEVGQVIRSTVSTLDLTPTGGGYRLSASGVHDAVPLAVEAALSLAGNSVELVLESLSIAGNRFVGEAVADLGVVPHRLEFDLRGDRFEWALPVESEDDWSSDARVGSDERLNLQWMREWDVVGRATLDQWVYEDLTVSNTTLDVSLDDGVLFVGPLRSELFGGRATAALKVDFSSGTRARWNLGLHAEDMYWSRWPTVSALGIDSVAPSEVLVDLEGFGRSTAEMLSTTDGKLQILMGESQLDGQALDALGGDLVLLLYRFVSAGQDEESQITDVQCGSVNLVFEEGIVDADRKVLIQSPHVDLFFNSAIDLHREKIEFNVLPRARGGVGVNLNKYFKSIKLAGNLTGLRPNIDAVGSVSLAAEVWAGALTGGASGVALGVFNAIRHRGKTCEGILPRMAEPGDWFSERG